MDKNAHDQDDFFKAAYQQFEEEPSADVWEKINTGLDKKDAVSNRRKFILWRRIAMLLILLLAGFVIIYPGMFKTKTGPSNLNTITKKSHTSDAPIKERAIINDEIKNADKETIRQNENDVIANTSTKNKSRVTQKNIASLKLNITAGMGDKTDKQFISDQHSGKRVGSINMPGYTPEKNVEAFMQAQENVQKEKMNPVLIIEKSNKYDLITELENSKRPVLFPSSGDTVLKISNVQIKKKEKKNSFIPFWMLTAFASYERAGYKLDSDLPNNITSIKHSEIPEPSFSGGILVTRQLSKHWGLQTGLVFSNTWIGLSPQKLYALSAPGGGISFKYITSTGYAYIKPGLGIPSALGDSLSTTEGKHKLQFISLPVMVKYSVGKKKLTITPGAGIEANLLTSAKVETEIEHPSNPEIVFINKLEGTKRFYLSVVADAELRYRLNKKISLTLRPAWRYALTPITKNNVVETFPNSVGVGMGLIWKL